MQKILEQIAVTAELMGSEISPTAAAVMAGDLSEYPKIVVIEALTNVRKESKSRLSLALVIEKIEEITPGGRPSPEEAWAMVPKNDRDSCVMSDEMSHALGIAQSLIDDGDMVGARMSFKEAYTSIVKFNKAHGMPVNWFPSLGYEKEGREPALAEAVRKKRLTSEHALRLINPSKSNEFLQLAGVKSLAIEDKSNPDNLRRIREVANSMIVNDD